MKSKLITGVVVLAILGAIVGINQYEPERATERQMQQEVDAAEEMAEINELEAQSEAEMAEEGEQDRLETLITEVQSTNPDEEGSDEAVVESVGDYKVHVEASNGEFVIQVRENLAPLGAKQFRAAVEDGVYDGARFFRVISGFMAQFGIPGNPDKARKWKTRMIQDDPVKASNTRGMVTFATSGPDSRTTQMFINYGDNSRLDGMGFAPIGEVIKGMDVVDAIFSGHGEKPDQGAIQRSGNRYLEAAYPELDYIIRAKVLDESGDSEGDAADAPEEAVDTLTNPDE